MAKYWIITKDVYKKNVKSLSFFVMLVIPFIAVGVFYFIGKMSETTIETEKIGVVITEQADEIGTIWQNTNTSAPIIVSQAEGEKQLKAKEIDGLLLITSEADALSAELLSEESLSQSTMLTVQQQLNQFQSIVRASELGLTQEEVTRLNQAVPLETKSVRFTQNGALETGKDLGAIRMVLSFASTILLFFFIITYASIIAQEIASEKGTRIMEVILSSVSASSHFYGKLTGILLVALTQLVVYGIGAGITFIWFKDNPLILGFFNEYSLASILNGFFSYTLIYLLFGVFIYAVLAALCGSLVSKVEDVSKAILPVTYLSLAGYMIGLTVGAMNPDHLIVRVSSFIPFLSSYTMPIRLAYGSASSNQVFISLFLLLLSIFILVVFSSKMYKANVLIYNDNGIWAALKQSFSLMKYQNNHKEGKRK